MSYLLCSIKDTKAGIYFAPQVFRSKGDFIRSTQVAAKDSKTMLHQFPADYELHVLCPWDERLGLGTPFGHSPDEEYPQRLGSVLDLCPLS